MHIESMNLMNFFVDKYLIDMKGCSVLDVGARNVHPEDQDSYSSIFKPDFKYFGMDVEPGNNVDIVGFENLKDKIFDIVISGQTMEHVNHPWDWLKSLTPFFSKYICIIAPHKFNEHRYPIDTYRYLPDGMRDLFNYAKIEIVEIIKGKKDTVGIGTKK